MKNRKSIITLVLAGMMSAAVLPCQAFAQEADYDYEDLYKKAREIVLYQTAYSQESIQPFGETLEAIDRLGTVNEILENIKNPDEELSKLLDNLRTSYEGLEQIADYDEVTFDIWEGHEELPIPGGEDPNVYDTALACLADDDGFRPFISDYRLDNPQEAKGTLIAVPSLRGCYSEQVEIANIFNEMGYNVFTLEPRMDTIEGLDYIMLQMDAQRAIRYVRYHAEDLNIDADKLILLGGSKGNFSHPMTFEYYDTTPEEYVEEKGSTLLGYKADDIDKEYANVEVCIVSYGALGLGELGTGKEFSENTILESAIYSQENMSQGLRFPDIVTIDGNLDGDTANVGGIINGLYNYNQLEDKLYTVNYEAHVMNGIPHGFGAGTQYENLGAQWNEIGVFVELCLNSKD